MTRFFLSDAETNALVELYNQQARIYHRMCAEPDIQRVRELAVERDAIGQQINLVLGGTPQLIVDALDNPCAAEAL